MVATLYATATVTVIVTVTVTVTEAPSVTITFLQRQPPNGQVRMTILVKGSISMPGGKMRITPSVVLLQNDGHNIIFDTPVPTDTQSRDQMLTGGFQLEVSVGGFRYHNQLQ